MKRRLFLTLIVLTAALTALYAKNPKTEKVPVIGISGYCDGSTLEANMTYINSVRKAGGVPLVIPVTSDDAQIEAVMGVIDGLIMTGGEDFDPLKWYGEEPLRALGEVVPTRDEFDVKLVRAAVAKGIPVLGICRGEQLLAVAFGGSLWQDIPSQIPSSYVKHRQGSTTGTYGTHSITIEKGSFLEKALDSQSATVNSFHHQAIKDVPQGFKVVAKSADGIIEGVERVAKLKDYPDGGATIYGTQFHPEVPTNAGNPTFLPIFQNFIKEASGK
jgi:Predicted glutamine amidotransferases